MAQTAKFMFDRTFEPPLRAAGGGAARDEWERKLAEARQAGYEEGRADGEAAARDSLEAETRETVGTLLDKAQRVLEAVDEECADIRRRSVELALTAANCLAADLVSRQPAAALEAMFAEALEHIGDAPHVVLTVNDRLADTIQERVSAIAAKRGFAGRIVVLGDPGTSRGDCHIQWADGGITLDMENTSRHIMRIVRRHLDGKDTLSNGHAGGHDAQDHQDTQSAHANGSGEAL